MAETSDIITCEVCRARAATIHICFASAGQTKELCAECYEKETPSEYHSQQDDLSETIKMGKCTYCGEPAKGGWTSGGVMPGLTEFGWQMQELWCEECGNDLKEFYEQPEQRAAMDADFDVADEEALTLFAKQFDQLTAAKHEFMRMKIIRRRGSRQS